MAGANVKEFSDASFATDVLGSDGVALILGRFAIIGMYAICVLRAQDTDRTLLKGDLRRLSTAAGAKARPSPCPGPRLTRRRGHRPR